MRSLERLLRPTIGDTQQVPYDEIITSGRMKSSPQLVPLVNALDENAMSSRIEDNVFELTEISKTPQYYEISNDSIIP